jgi:TRAP-type mannitol/chloroaromatic compound transport system substrate-binding protein
MELYNELLQKEFKMNVVLLSTTTLCWEAFGWFCKPFDTLDEPRQIRFRKSGHGLQMMQNMGVEALKELVEKQAVKIMQTLDEILQAQLAAADKVLEVEPKTSPFVPKLLTSQHEFASRSSMPSTTTGRNSESSCTSDPARFLRSSAAAPERILCRMTACRRCRPFRLGTHMARSIAMISL